MNVNLKLPFLRNTLDQNTFRILYYKNKMYLLPTAIILLAGLLLFFAVIPQVQDYLSLREEEKNIKEKIVITKNNYSLLSRVDENELNNNLQVAVSALPSEKDFGGILRAIGQAARSSNVILGDFSFQIGNLSPGATKVTNALPIEVTLTINSGINEARSFLQELTNRLPLSEASNIRTSETSSTINVIFYYKPFPAMTLSESNNIKPLSAEEISLLNKLSLFKSTFQP